MLTKLFTALVSLFCFVNLALATPPLGIDCPHTGHTTCFDGRDTDGDGFVNDTAPAAGFISVDTVNYHIHLKDANKIGSFANVTDASFESSTKVEPTAGEHYTISELWDTATFTNATYDVWIYYTATATPRPVWVKKGSSHFIPDNINDACFLPSRSSPGWAQCFKAGSGQNFIDGANSATALTLALNGVDVITIKTNGVSLGGIYLRKDGDTTSPNLPGETSAGVTDHYEVFKANAGDPTDCDDSDFDNANIWAWIGIQSAGYEGAPTTKMLHDGTNLFICAEFTDAEIIATTTANDDAGVISADDNLSFSFRGDGSTTPPDTNTYTLKVGAKTDGGIWTGDYSGNNGTKVASGWNPTVTRTVDFPSGKWRVFLKIPMPFTLSDALKIVGELVASDYDTGTVARAQGFGPNWASVNDPTQWAGISFLAATVPGGADSTAPTVTSPALPAALVLENTMVMTATTDEAGTCRAHYGTVTNTYTDSTTGSPSINGVCSETLLGLTANDEYFVEMRVTDAAGNVGDSTEVSATTDATAFTHHGASSTSGAADCSSATDEGLVSTCLALLVPGSHLGLADGTYAGALSMLKPPSGLSGTEAQPITVSAKNDGAVTFDGEDTQRFVVYLPENDWWILEGFNAHSSTNLGTDSGTVVWLSSGSDHNIVRRVVAWDAPDVNSNVFGTHGNTSNLFEDVAGFGVARKIFSSSQRGNNTTVRRGFFIFQGQSVTGSVPKSSITAAYNNYNLILENIITMWHETSTFGFGTGTGLISTDRFQGPANSNCANSKVLGSMAIVRDQDVMSPNDRMVFLKKYLDCFEFRDTVIYAEPGSYDTITMIQAGNFDGTDRGGPASCVDAGGCDRTITDTTEIGGGDSNIGTDAVEGWTVTNRGDYATIAAMTAASASPFQDTTGNGARVCFQTVDGSLTGTKLWPWPMEQRIYDAYEARYNTAAADAFFGAANGGPTKIIEDIWGTIPSDCKS